MKRVRPTARIEVGSMVLVDDLLDLELSEKIVVLTA